MFRIVKASRAAPRRRLVTKIIRPAVAGLAAALMLAPVARAQEATPRIATIVGIGSGYTSDGGVLSLSLSGHAPNVLGSGTGKYGVGGGAGLSFGLGDATNGIGIQAGATFTSLHAGFLNSGYLDVRLSRRFTAGQTAGSVMLGVTQLAGFGDASVNDPSYIAAITLQRQFPLFGNEYYPVMATLGYGTRSAYRRVGNDLIYSGGLWGGVGIGLTPSLAASAAYDGGEAIIGIGYQPPIRGTYVTIAAHDVTNRTQRRRVAFSVSYTFDNLFRR